MLKLVKIFLSLHLQHSNSIFFNPFDFGLGGKHYDIVAPFFWILIHCDFIQESVEKIIASRNDCTYIVSTEFEPRWLGCGI